MKQHHPPKWADRFLSWYCDPHLLEEIQGDAWQLYFERLEREGKAGADIKYIWDVIRFFRWSNIRKPGRSRYGTARLTLWTFNLKLAVRHAGKHKLIFGIKTAGLALCVAFTFLVIAYIVNELTFDTFHRNHNRIYRVVSTVRFPDHTTNYAVTPLPMGKALLEGIPEVEGYFRFMYEERPVFRIDDKVFNKDRTLAADSNFLRMLTFEFIAGGAEALDHPNKVVLTESLAKKYFGTQHALGKTVEYGEGMLLEVAGVIRNVPSNSHLDFDAIISWDSFTRYDAWANLNAYTYILLREGASISSVEAKMPTVLSTFHDLVAREYKATYEAVFQNLTAIHFSQHLDEDIAEKRNKMNVHILMAVVVLFIVTALANYLNLTLAEITSNLKKLGIIRVFGGVSGRHQKLVGSDTTLSLLVLTPIVLFTVYAGLQFARTRLSIDISPTVLGHPFFIATIAAFVALLFVSSTVNSFILSRSGQAMTYLQGNATRMASGIRIRKILAGIQLSFSMLMIAMITIISDQFDFIQKADKGFNAENRVAIKLPSEDPQLGDGFIDEIRKIPGIAEVAGSSYYPGIIETKYVFEIERETGMRQMLVPMIRCGYEYFKVLNINTVAGRTFDITQLSDQDAAYVVNETAAKEFGWPDAIGKKIRGPLSGDNHAYREGNVIGVVQDFNFATMHSKIEPVIIFLTDKDWGSQFVYAKINPLSRAGLIDEIGHHFKDRWPEHAFDWEFLDEKYRALYTKDIEVANIFKIGLVISIMISCLGVFSISALITALRSKEMGIRKVMGATGIHLFNLHVKSLFNCLVVAIVIACPLILISSHQWLQNFAYKIQVDPTYFLIPAIIAFILVILVAGYHGLKGSYVNVITMLKHPS